MRIGKRLLSAFCVSAIVFTASGCSGNKNTSAMNIFKLEANEPSDSWDKVEDFAVLENDNIRFELDGRTTHFKITDKLNGNTFYSSPADETEYISDDITARLSSEIVVRYYGEQTEEMFMYSSDSVAAGGFDVRTNGEAVRVVYTFGEEQTFIPAVFDKETFEAVLGKLESDAMRRRLERYYIRYSADDRPEDYGDKLKQYPVLASEELYIIDDLASDIEKEDIALYISYTDFDAEQYEAMLKKLKIDNVEVEKNAGFTVPVEYTVDGEGFSATVLSDLIKENSDDYKLQKIDVLEFFAAEESDNGSFLVPDGSGALVGFGTEGEISLPFYGEDYSVRKSEKELIDKSCALPVFGISSEKGGVLAIVEQASEVAGLNVKPNNSSSPLNHAYVSFVFRSIDSTDYGADMQIPVYNLFAKTRLEASPKIKYILLSKNENSYYAMAKKYRSYLVKEGVLGEGTDTSDKVYIDYLCMITEKAGMLGVPYTKKTVLSTVSEITESVKQLKKAGVGPIVVRLFGYSSGGYEHSVYNRFGIDKSVGTVEELKALNGLLAEDGGMLCLDADMQFAFNKGNGFSPSKDAARYLNKLIVSRGQYDIVSRDYASERLLRYFVSPADYKTNTELFIKALNKKWGTPNKPALSFGSTGIYLGGDYTKTRDIDRAESAYLTAEALERVQAEKLDMVFDNGNAYVLKYASALLNVPTSSSLLDTEYKSVPFFSSVICGKLSCAGAPMNFYGRKFAYVSDALLGLSPYACFITGSDSQIFNTDYETMWYSLSDESRLESFAESVLAAQKIAKLTGGAECVEYEKIDSDIVKAVYDDGRTVYANIGTADKVFNGKRITAGGYVTEGE